MSLGAQAATVPAADLEQAREYLAAQSYGDAITALRKLQQRFPDDVQVNLLIGQAYLGQGAFPQAVDSYRRAAKRGAKREVWMGPLGRALLGKGEYRRLLKGLDPRMVTDPKLRSELLALRGRAQLAREAPQQAASLFALALKLDADNLDAKYGQAQLLMEDRKWKAALPLMNQLVNQAPERFEFWMARGDLHLLLGDLQRSYGDLSTAASLAPRYPPVRYLQASAALALGKKAEAQEAVVVLRAQDRESPLADYIEGAIAFSERKFVLARELLERSLVRRPADVRSQYLYGAVSYELGYLESARTYLARSAKRMPDRERLVRLRASTSLKLAALEEAKAILTAGVKRFPRNADLHAMLGFVHQEQGRHPEGIRHLRRAVVLDPRSQQLKLALAGGLAKAGKIKEAQALVSSLREAGVDTRNAEELLLRAYVKAGAHGPALDLAQARIARFPKDPKGYLLLGRVQEVMGDADGASATYRRVIKAHPGYHRARMRYARLLRRGKRYSQAITQYESILKRDPKHLDALLALYRVAGETRNPRMQVRWLELAIERVPDDRRAAILLAQFYIRHKRPLEAVQVLESMPPALQQRLDVLYMLAVARADAKSYAEAGVVLRKLTERYPRFAPGWRDWGMVRLMQGDRLNARFAFERATALDPKLKLPEAHFELARLLIEVRRFKQAHEVIGRILKVHPNEPRAHDLAARAYLGAGKPDAALQSLQAAFRQEKTSARARSIARLQWSEKRHKQAISVLNDWIKLTPKDAEALALLGQIHLDAGDQAAAIKAYKASLRHGPGNPFVLNNLAYIYLEQDNPLALPLARQAYEVAPNRPEIADSYGWLLVRSGRVKAGAEILLKAHKQLPANAELAFHAGKALYLAEKDAQARSILEHLAAMHPKTKWGAEGKKLLKEFK